MTEIEAFHLPAMVPGGVTRWSVRVYDDDVRLRVPVLAPEALEGVIAELRSARERGLVDMPVARIVEAIDEAAARLDRPDSPERQLLERALPAVTGYSPPMIRLILDRMIADWRAPALERLLRSELGDPRVLDGFRSRGPDAGSARTRAFGPDLAFHIFAGNVPGVAVTALVRSLLVKAATLGKTASGEPLLSAVFARTLAEVAPEIGECLAVTYWPGGSADLEEVALDAADTVVVYGGEEAEESVRARSPIGTRLVVHGPKLSFAAVAREALGADHVDSTARDVAAAVAAFDQQGCVSPHVVYVEKGAGVEPERFAKRVAREFAELQKSLPRGRISAAEASTIQQLRGSAEFRALAGEDVRIFASTGTEYTVIYDADPAFNASCLNRVLWVKPLDNLEDVAARVRPFARYLQTAGIAAADERVERLAEALGRIGVARVTNLERMPWPAPSWHHDGREPLRELLRWTDLEG